jgi:hypothetical protein
MGNTPKVRPGQKAAAAEPGRSWWRPLLPLALALGVGIAAPITVAVARPSAVDRQVDQLRAADASRDVEQVKSLTALARRTQAALVPVLDGLSRALPVGVSAPGPAAAGAAVVGWRRATGAAVESFAHPPSGGTAVNVARSGLAAAVTELDLAVSSYQAALALPEAERAAVLSVAARQRDAAVAAWSVAATQLDVVNIDAGFGHAHVFLPSVPGQGALTADEQPEGEGHR